MRVTLADAPTDVLVFLAARPGRGFTPPEIALAVAPKYALQPAETISSALRLLRDAGYADVNGVAWTVTADGMSAVERARVGNDGSGGAA